MILLSFPRLVVNSVEPRRESRLIAVIIRIPYRDCPLFRSRGLEQKESCEAPYGRFSPVFTGMTERGIYFYQIT